MTLALIIIPLAIFWLSAETSADNPRPLLPKRKPHTSPTNILPGPFNLPQEVTRRV